MSNRNNESWICALYSSYSLNMFTSPFGPSKNPYHNSSAYSKLSSTLFISHLPVTAFSLLCPLQICRLLPAPTYPPLQLTGQGVACAATGSQQCASWYAWAAGSKKPFHLECILSKLFLTPPHCQHF